MKLSLYGKVIAWIIQLAIYVLHEFACSVSVTHRYDHFSGFERYVSSKRLLGRRRGRLRWTEPRLLSSCILTFELVRAHNRAMLDIALCCQGYRPGHLDCSGIPMKSNDGGQRQPTASDRSCTTSLLLGLSGNMHHLHREVTRSV